MCAIFLQLKKLPQNISFKFQVCAAEYKSREYYAVYTHTTAVHIFQNPIFTAVFVLFTTTCFFVFVPGKCDTINSHLKQIFMCATVNIKTMLLHFLSV